MTYFTRDGGNNTRNSHLWDSDNPHGTVESSYQHLFAVEVWCSVVGDQLIGPYVLPPRDIYVNFLQYELPALLENFPIQTRRQIYYEHDGGPPHFSQVVRIPKPMDWSWGTQNLPPRSPDLNPLNYHVWGYMKATVCAHGLNTRDELNQWILSTARSINNAAVLRKFTSSLVTRVRKWIQADGGHFEKHALVLNGESVTVHSTTYLNKCTVLLFPF